MLSYVLAHYIPPLVLSYETQVQGCCHPAISDGNQALLLSLGLLFNQHAPE